MIDLERDLRATADAYDLPAGDLDAVRARGDRRRARRTGVARGGAALAAVALVAGVTALGSGGGDEGTPVASEGAPIGGSPAFSWTAHQPSPDEAISMFGRPAGAAGGRLYALSTAPGVRETDGPHPKVTWTSADGTSWSPVGTPDDLYLTDLVGRGDRVYAVGTGPANGVVSRSGQEVPTALVGWSDDGTASFETASLPVDLAPIAAVARAVMHQVQVSTVDGTVVVVLGVRVDLDAEAVLPDGVDAPHGWVLTPEGLTVLGAPKEGCDVDHGPNPGRVWSSMCGGDDKAISPMDAHEPGTTYSWNELGVSGDVLEAVLGHPFVFAGTGEEGFDRVDLPDLPATVGTFALEGGDLLLLSDGHDVPVSLRTTDGRTWEAAGSLPAGMRWASSIGRVGDRTVVIGDRILVGSGGSWTDVDVAELLGDGLADGQEASLGPAGIGPAGAVITGLTWGPGDEGPGRWFVLTSRDGATWAAEWLDDLAGARVGTVGQVVVTDDRLVVQAGLAGERNENGHVRQAVLVGAPAAG